MLKNHAMALEEVERIRAESASQIAQHEKEAAVGVARNQYAIPAQYEMARQIGTDLFICVIAVIGMLKASPYVFAGGGAAIVVFHHLFISMLKNSRVKRSIVEELSHPRTER